jgi:beta-aspartyl-peptidase (threonine type)
MSSFGNTRIFLVLVLVAFAVHGCASEQSETKVEDAPIVMVIHAGAGTIKRDTMAPEREAQIRAALLEALQAGYSLLESGASALDAVEAACRVLEDSPEFNAGKGAVFTNQGKNEMDASIMDGSTTLAGAVASVTTIRNPISAARRVMENTKHVMLVGRGAELFAAEQGLEIIDPDYFFTQRRWDALLKAKEREREEEAEEKGTAAALALDSHGNLAAGTSTGGLTNKMHGRVGDTPIIGAGTYANNTTCAVSGTGQGEFFMRGLVAYQVSALMEFAGISVEEAAQRVIDERVTARGGQGGLIALDKHGNVAMPFNTAGMYRGYWREGAEPQVLIYGDE